MKRIRLTARIGSVAAVITAALAYFPAAAPVAHASAMRNATVSSNAATLNQPVTGVVATPTGNGYWRVAADGGVLGEGDAHYYGSAVGRWHTRVVGIAATPTGHGYWLVDDRGDVFNFGDAPNRGSAGGWRLNKPIVGIAGTPDGQGYWLVASDGGVFAFHAPYRGSAGAWRLNKPIVGMAATPSGTGYWLVASDGGIFGFHAPYKGSTGAWRLNAPIVGMAPASDGTGYTLVARDGGVFRFPSSLSFYGSAANACTGAPAVGVATSDNAVGYWVAFANAQTFAFSPTSHSPPCAPPAGTKIGDMQNDLFTRLNQERAARGLAPMKWDPALAGYASLWGANMAANGFRHSDISSLLGPYNAVGENIAAGSPGVTTGGLHNAWMHSTQGHRENILSLTYDHVGVGAFCTADGTIFLVEDFGHPAAEGGFASSPSQVPVNPVARPDAGTLHC